MSLSDFLKSIFGSKVFGDDSSRDWRKIYEIDGDGKDKSVFSQFQGGLKKQMEMLQKGMEEMFKKIDIEEKPSEMQPPAKKRMPFVDRDEILKELEPFFHKEKEWEFNMPFRFGDFGPKLGYGTESEDWKDEDLDGKIDDKDISKMFERFRQQPRKEMPIDRPRMFSGHNSVSISTFRGTDGRIEHTKTVKDFSGTEEKTVTRTLGDKTHTVTTRTDPKGVQEKVETLKNIDENDLPTFEKAWTSRELPESKSVPHLPSSDPSDQSVFSKIFEMPWK